MKAGNKYTIDFRVKDLDQIQGYQFGLRVNREMATIEGVEEGVATAENFGYRLIEEGIITTSWHDITTETKYVGTANEQVMFSIVVQVKENVSVQDLLSISSDFLSAEAYNQLDKVLAVKLDYGSNIQRCGRL